MVVPLSVKEAVPCDHSRFDPYRLHQFMNTKKQGDIGLGAAIAYFTKLGITVAISLTDSQDYDLIIDKDNKLQRIQVKHTTYKRNGKFLFSLTVKGGNRSSVGKIKKFNVENVDAVFVVTGEGGLYYIPTIALGGYSGISLYEYYDQFKV